MKGYFKCKTINDQDIIILGEGHSYKSIEDFNRLFMSKLIDDPYTYYYLLEIPEDLDFEKYKHEHVNLLLFKLWYYHLKNTSLIDFSTNDCGLNLSFPISDLFTENFTINKFIELFENIELPQKDEISWLNQKTKDEFEKINEIKILFKENIENSFYLFINYLKTKKLFLLSYLLRQTNKAMNNRDIRFVKEILNCKHKKILVLVGFKHLEGIYKILSKEKQIVFLDDIILL